MKMRFLKMVVSMLLVLCISIGLIPISANAEETQQGQSSIEDLIAGIASVDELSDGSILNYTHVIGFYEVTPIDRMKVAILSVGTELQDVTVNTNDLREREISIAEWLCVSESAK